MKTQDNSIALETLKQDLANKKEIIIIDVRNLDEYNEKHIPSAISIPLDRLEEIAGAFGKSKLYVTACGKGGGRSAEGAVKLQGLGFDAIYLCGGTFGWFDNQ